MLLTITTTHAPATDLGFLLHKNPERVHDDGHVVRRGPRRLPRGEPTSGAPRRCSSRSTRSASCATARARRATSFSLAQYVNDRPYAASSFLSVAINKVFGTAHDRPQQGAARAGRAGARRSSVHLPGRARAAAARPILRRLFEPLGYDGRRPTTIPLDPTVPGVGRQPLPRRDPAPAPCRLRDLLEHLFVLLPVLDDDKHYWVGADEVDKLLRRGGDWLAAHPDRELITRRYLRHDRRLTTRRARPPAGRRRRRRPRRGRGRPRRRRRPRSRSRSASTSSGSPPSSTQLSGRGRATGRRPRLRRGQARPARSCATRRSSRSLGVDVSYRALEVAARRLHLDTMAPRQRERVELVPGRADLPRPPPAGLRRGHGRRGHRAPRPAPARRLRAGAVRPRPPGDGRRHHAQRRVQRAVRDPARRRAPPPRPPLRVDPGRVRRLGRRRRRHATATPSSSRGIGPDDAERRRARRRWRCSADDASPSPSCALVALVGVSGSGKSTLRRPPLPARPRSCRRTSAAASSATTRTTRRPPTAAFDVLHFIAGKRLEAGRLTVVDATNVQPEARKPLVALAKEHHTSGGGDRARRARDGLRRAQRRPARPRLRRPRAAQPAQPAPPVDEEPPARGLPPGLRPRRRRGDRRRHHRAPAAVERPARRPRALRHHRRRPRLLRRAGRAARRRSATRSRADGTGAHHPDGRRAVLRRRPRRPRPGHAGGAPPRHGHGRRRRRAVHPRQPRDQAAARPAGPQRARSATAWPRRSPSSPRSRPSSPREVAAFIDGLVSHLVLDDGKLVVAHAGLRADMHGRASGAVRSLRPLRRHHRRDRRVRPARPLPVGRGLPGRRHGRLRPHAGARGRRGSTARSASTPAASSAASSPRCATPSASWCRCRRPATYWEPARPLVAAAPADADREPTDLDLDDVSASASSRPA